MAGGPDQEVVAFSTAGKELAPQMASLRNRNSTFTEMHAARSAGQRDIHPVVHKNSCPGTSARDAAQRFAYQIHPFLSAIVLLAELNPIGAGGGGSFHVVQKQPIGVRGSRQRQTPAVRHIT